MPKKDQVKPAPNSEKKKVGRPSSFTQEVADDICTLLAQGESLRKICERPGMPAMSSVFKWLNENQQFSEQYVRAREVTTESMLEDVLMIADGATPEDVQVAKLRVDARKWVMSKLAPKKYGDKVTQEISGTMTNQNINLSSDEFRAIAKELLEKV